MVDKQAVRFYLKRLKSLKKHIVIMALQMLLVAIINIILAYLYMKAIDQIADGKILYTVMMVAGYFGLSVIVGFMERQMSVYATKMTTRLEYELQNEIFEKMLKQKGNFYTENKSGEFMTYLFSDAMAISGFISETFLKVVMDVLKGIGMVIFLIFLRWELLLLIIGFQPVIWLMQKGMQRKIFQISEQNRSILVEYISKTKEYCTNFLNIVMLSSEKYFKTEYTGILKKQKESEIQKSKVESLNGWLLKLVYLLPMCAIIILGSYEINKGVLTVGGLLLFLQYVGEVFAPFQNIYEMIFEFTELIPSFQRLQNLLEHKLDKEVMEYSGESIYSIGMKKARFSYEKGKPILRSISFSLEKGHSYAFIGESGCGKSTVCKLLLGLWELDGGNIMVNGKKIESDVSLRDSITYISQENFILNDTIYNNIVLDSKDVTQAKFQQVLKISGLWDMVNGLELKENTIMGDNGVLFSGGQNHRIAIARALIKDKPIVILDEPTASLDKNMEQRIMKDIFGIFQNKIVMVITHNSDVSRWCDYIYEIGQGKLIGKKVGSKNEICKNCHN